MKMFKPYLVSFFTIVISGWLGYLLINAQSCNGSHNTKNAVASDTTITKSVDAVFDSIAHSLTNENITASHTDTFYFPPEYIYKSSATKIDTQAVLKAFFSCRLSTSDYRDSNVFISVKDSICLFQLLDRQITYKILRPDSIITIKETITNTITEKPKIHFSLGAMASAKDMFCPGVMIQKNKIAVIANYGVTQGLGLGFYYQLK